MNKHLEIKPAEQIVDHLLLGINDLDKGIEWVENLTGVKARLGGSHPGVGTRNALLALGGRRYLEIIAPDPAQPAFRFRIDLRSLAWPRLVAWAVSTTDTDAILKASLETGHPVVGPEEGSRAIPDGRAIRWSLIRLKSPYDAAEVEVIPFFIKWAEGSIHPSEDSSRGCQLVSLHLTHPDPVGVTAMLERFAIKAHVPHGEGRLVAELNTPKGVVEIS